MIVTRILLACCILSSLPVQAKEKLPKNTQIVYPNSDGSPVELKSLGGPKVSTRQLLRTEWIFTRDDVDKINTVFSNYTTCEQHTRNLEAEIEKILQDDRVPMKKPFFSTTIGHWTIGIGAASLVIGGGVVGYKLGKK